MSHPETGPIHGTDPSTAWFEGLDRDDTEGAATAIRDGRADGPTD